MKKFHLIIMAVICILGTAACGSSSKAEISFKDMDLSGVSRIDLRDLHTGTIVSVTGEEEISEIISFIKEVRGVNAQSSKGYYEGTYEALLYANDDNVFAIGFGDSDVFNYGKGSDGYPVRYELADKTVKEDVVPFFSRFFARD